VVYSANVPAFSFADTPLARLVVGLIVLAPAMVGNRVSPGLRLRRQIPSLSAWSKVIRPEFTSRSNVR
jgi:hypothetical protein